MKSTFKLLLAAVALIISVGSVSAQQKIGYINMQEVVMAMPEVDSVNKQLEAYGKELNDQFAALNTELSSKIQDYQAKASTFSDLIRQQKDKEIKDLSMRLEEFQQMGNEDIQKKQQELFQPLFTRAQDAVKKVGKDQSLLYILDLSTNMIPYYNETVMVNALPAVKKILGIQ